MTETSTTRSRGTGRRGSRGARQGNPLARLFGRIALFVRQVLDEMRKVVWPTRQELINYTAVVLVFIVLIMLYVVGLDQVFQRAVSWVFGSS
ncbi:preprotein translocase subunit SecE [Luteipulveratus sp. YIM 133132]|uniref:Protein translocase subunit SecE n=1 Tax=Luteipulveratus flavus TaxID=3031728 RepID=A0ABT6C6H4_9MICO|nr:MULTISPECIES: preprotein translocase subunit SecE [unclassified Luteipulveratus]MDE9365179.1 preprotein translocase subunit SecE [Luteipulveratus sp. YIM 133132]MDF8264485.1 preprotein translocase subunit SecE [Luteipulveratus sp. YIM 133296]